MPKTNTKPLNVRNLRKQIERNNRPVYRMRSYGACRSIDTLLETLEKYSQTNAELVSWCQNVRTNLLLLKKQLRDADNETPIRPIYTAFDNLHDSLNQKMLSLLPKLE